MTQAKIVSGLSYHEGLDLLETWAAHREEIREIQDSMRPGTRLSDAILEFRRRETEREKADQ